MAQAVKRNTTTRGHRARASVLLDPTVLPDEYAMRVVGAMRDIEAELASRKLLTPDEIYEVLRIALENLSDEASTIVEENDIGLLRAVRHGLAWMQGPPNKPA